MQFSVATFFLSALAFNGVIALPASVDTPRDHLEITADGKVQRVAADGTFVSNVPVSADVLKKVLASDGQSKPQDDNVLTKRNCSTVLCNTDFDCHSIPGCSGCLFFQVTPGGLCF